jgi:hypothetical protein
MPQTSLAQRIRNRNNTIMREVPGRKEGFFKADATEVIGSVKMALANVVAALGVKKPGELQRILTLDSTLSYQIFRIISERDVLAAGSSIPSRVSIDRFVKSAEKKGIAAELLEAIAAAYSRFEGLVERHAGDRTSFNSLVTGAAGLSNEWLNADLQHRRNIFRGVSHVMGVQARTRIAASFLAPKSDATHNLVYIVGLIGLRMLRELERVSVHYARHALANAQTSLQPLSISSDPSSYLLDKYSMSPLPRLEVERSERDEAGWVQTSLVRPEIGNAGVTSLLFGGKAAFELGNPDGVQLSQVISIPIEVLIHDLIVLPGTIPEPPNHRVFLGNDLPRPQVSDTQDVVGDYQLEFLGKGPGVLATPDLPAYPDLARDVAAELGHDIENFEVWRAKLEFPVYRSTSRIYWGPKGRGR